MKLCKTCLYCRADPERDKETLCFHSKSLGYDQRFYVWKLRPDFIISNVCDEYKKESRIMTLKKLTETAIHYTTLMKKWSGSSSKHKMMKKVYEKKLVSIDKQMDNT